MRPISELAFGEEAVIGETYLVPCMNLVGLTYAQPHSANSEYLKHAHLLTEVPVIGTAHTDPEFPGCGGETMHVHVDTRFMTATHLAAWRLSEYSFLDSAKMPSIPIVPTTADNKYPSTFLHAMVCKRPTPNHAETTLCGPGYEEFEDSIEGAVLKLDHPVCPHQGTPLNGIAAINGRIHCPTHGLGFCAASGKMIRKTRKPKPPSEVVEALNSLYNFTTQDFGSAFRFPAVIPPDERTAACST